jgi:toxin-antitoxin system PIN domain toxin
MSRTIDANVLLYASDASSPNHHAALTVLEAIAAGPGIVYLFWPTAMTYLRIATHPSIFARPLALDEAIGNLEGLLARPHVRTAVEGEAFWHRFREIAIDVRPGGNLVPDAHLVALMHEHGVGSLVTHDRDYRRFRGIAIEDPFA